MTTSSTAELEFSESDQIKLVLEGDADAFCRLIRAHRQLLYCKAVSIVRQEADAEEIVQNVMWKAFRSLAGFRQECQLRTWLITITINECRMFLRRARRLAEESLVREDGLGESELIEVADERGTPFEVMEQSMIKAHVHRAVGSLPSRLGDVFRLRDLELRSIAETSRILGISPVAVKSRLWRGRRLLRRTLEHLRAA